MASWSKTLAGELPPELPSTICFRVYTERLDALRSAIAQKRQCTEQDVQQTWMDGCPSAWAIRKGWRERCGISGL